MYDSVTYFQLRQILDYRILIEVTVASAATATGDGGGTQQFIFGNYGNFAVEYCS